MTTFAARSTTGLQTTTAAKGHIGLVVLGAIASGLAARPGARARRLRRRARARDHRCGAARSRFGLRLPRGRIDPLQRPATAVGACSGGRGGCRRSRDLGSRAERPHARARRMGLARAAGRSRRLVVPRRSPGAAQLVTPGRPLSGSLRAPACRGRRRLRDRRRGDLIEPSARRSHLSRQRAPPLPELRRRGRADGRPLQRAGRAHAELGVGAANCLVLDPRLHLRPGRRGLERRRAGRSGRRASFRPTCMACFALRTSRAPTCSPGTRSAAPTRFSTPRTIPSRSPVSP